MPHDTHQASQARTTNPMKVIIAGSRTIKDQAVIERAIRESGFQIAEVVSGCAEGVDRTAMYLAINAGLMVRRFPADWNAHGKAAGPIRNNQMAEYADALIAIWDGSSRGTKHMIEAAKKRGLKVFVYNPEREG